MLYFLLLQQTPLHLYLQHRVRKDEREGAKRDALITVLAGAWRLVFFSIFLSESNTASICRWSSGRASDGPAKTRTTPVANTASQAVSRYGSTPASQSGARRAPGQADKKTSLPGSLDRPSNH